MSTYTAVLNPSLTDNQGLYKPFSRVFGPGVSTAFNAASLQVVQRGAGANMSVDVSPGDAHLLLPSLAYSFLAWTDAATNVVITTANPTNPRIDVIVGWVDTTVTTTGSNNSPGSFKFAAMPGTPAGTPNAVTDTSIQASLGASIAWVKLAYVYVGAGVTNITSSVITDARTVISLRTGTVMDSNSNELLTFGTTASAVNQVTITNAATGNGPIISSTGNDSNIDINFAPKGTGQLRGIVDHLYNPYKFSAFRNASWNTSSTANTFAVVPFDSTLYDTSSNFNTTTNSFVAATAGFYHFSASVGVAESNNGMVAVLYKNGSVIKVGTALINAAGVFNAYATVAADLKLAANDYVQVYFSISQASAAGITGAPNTYFDGHLVSTT